MWAVDSDGLVAGAYRPRHLMEGCIDLLDLTGNVTRTIDTGSYIPQQVVFAPDHTIWTAAYNARNDGAQDFNVLHHYARTGEELGEALSWSQIAGGLKHPVVETSVEANFSLAQTIASAGTKLYTPAPAPGSKLASQESFWGSTT